MTRDEEEKQSRTPLDSESGGGLRIRRRRALFLSMLGILGALGAAAGIPFLSRRIVEHRLSSGWQRSQQKILDEASRIEAENAQGHHSGLAILADPSGFTLLGTTRRGRELGWLLRVDPEGVLIWERTLPELDDPATVVRDGEGYLIAGSQDETRGRRRSYAAAVQKVSSDGRPGPFRVHPPGGVSAFRGPHRGAVLFLRESGEVERVLPIHPQGSKTWGHLARAARLSDGRVVAVGAVQEQDGEQQGWLVELDDQGGVRERARTGSRLTAVAASADGSFDVAGVELVERVKRVFVSHWQDGAPGQPPHEVRFPAERGAWVADLAVLPDGDRVLIGTTTRLGAGKTNLWLARVTRSGTVRWERGYGAP